MDKLSQAIIAMEVHFSDKESRLRAQWETISTVLAEGQKPSTNTASREICPICKGDGWTPCEVVSFVNMEKVDHSIKKYCDVCSGSGKLQPFSARCTQ